MFVPDRIRITVESYHNDWRHPRLSPLVCSQLYSIFPEETGVERPTVMNWPTPWPNNDHPGVYFIFGKTLELLYVGKTTFFGRRLSHHFPESVPTRLRDEWVAGRPTFLATVAVTERFEAASLEEYLIYALDPPENKMSRRKVIVP